MSQMIRDMESFSLEETKNHVSKSSISPLPSPRSVLEMANGRTSPKPMMNMTEVNQNRKIVSPRSIPNNKRSSPITGRSLPNENTSTVNNHQSGNIKRSKSMEQLKVGPVGSYRPNLINEKVNVPDHTMQFNNYPKPGKLSLFAIEEEPNNINPEMENYIPPVNPNQYPPPPNQFLPNMNVNVMSHMNNYPPNDMMFNNHYPNEMMLNNQYHPNMQFQTNQYPAIFNNQVPMTKFQPHNNQYSNIQYPPNNQFTNNQYPANIQYQNNQYPPNNQFPPNQYPVNQFPNNQYPPNTQFPNYQHPPFNNSYNNNTFNDPFYDPREEQEKLNFYKLNKRKSWSGRSNEYNIV
jgi:hypothetical protein